MGTSRRRWRSDLKRLSFVGVDDRYIAVCTALAVAVAVIGMDMSVYEVCGLELVKQRKKAGKPCMRGVASIV